MLDLLLPRTDAGVAVQVVAVTLLFAAVAWLFRRNRDARLLVIGLWITTYGAIGMRALH